MNDDTIYRKAAIDAFGLSEKTRKFGGDHSGYKTMMLYEIQDVIENIPAVDPRKGKWGHDFYDAGEEGEYWFMYCDQCEAEFSTDAKFWNYCPNCGAQMEECE